MKSNKKVKAIVILIITAVIAVGIVLMIIGRTRGENFGNAWDIWSILFLGSTSTIMGAFLIRIFREFFKVYQNKLILKEFGTPKSKTKTYYVHNAHDIHVGDDGGGIETIKRAGDLIYYKFTSRGLYCRCSSIDKRYKILSLMFLWNDVIRVINHDEARMEIIDPIFVDENVIIETGTLKIYTNTSDTPRILPNHEIYVKLIQTFWSGEIESL